MKDSREKQGSALTPGNLNTLYDYDRLDRLTTITQGTGTGGQTRLFAYDSLGRLTRQKLAEQTATLSDAGCYVNGTTCTGTASWSDAFVYDTRSNVTQRIDARGVKSNFSYDLSGSPDPLNRLQGISYDTSTTDTTYTINSAAAVTLEYMTTGDQSRVKKVTTSGVATEENAFDVEGRISQYKLTMTSRSSYPFTTDYSYDTANRLTQVTYPAQYGMTGSPRKAIVPSYDEASRLTQMTVDGSTQLSDITYNTSSQVTSLKTGAATSYPRAESYSYDAQTGLLTGQTVKNTSATSTYLDLAYSYTRGNSFGTSTGSEKTGQMTKIVDNLDHNRDKANEFDALGRIHYAKGGTAAGASSVTANWTQSYSYDRYGNKTGVTATGQDQNTATIAADGLTSVSVDSATNRMTTASGWLYDLAGNLIRGQNASGVWQRFEYDAAGRLVKIKDDSNNVLETYTYGATRKRFINETSSGRTYYAWGGQSVIAEYTESGIQQGLRLCRIAPFDDGYKGFEQHRNARIPSSRQARNSVSDGWRHRVGVSPKRHSHLARRSRQKQPVTAIRSLQATTEVRRAVWIMLSIEPIRKANRDSHRSIQSECRRFLSAIRSRTTCTPTPKTCQRISSTWIDKYEYDDNRNITKTTTISAATSLYFIFNCAFKP